MIADISLATFEVVDDACLDNPGFCDFSADAYSDLGMTIHGTSLNDRGDENRLLPGTDFNDILPGVVSTGMAYLPFASSPMKPIAIAFPPSATTFAAALAAPPGRVRVSSCFIMKTGASRETRSIVPLKNWSATRSPITIIFLLANFSLIMSEIIGSILQKFR